ncbi:MAG TPA: beta-galactosidase GalB [Ignavibacteriaceae bacterium]|nr:beta-galactosidase GalB [Ignavibacteriaceae bacterium]
MKSFYEKEESNIFLFHSIIILLFSFVFISTLAYSAPHLRKRITENFDNNWRFHLGDVKNGQSVGLNDSAWRILNLPHDWSIEGKFSKDNPAGINGGALPGGIGWYRKSFTIKDSERDKKIFIDFDGVYRNSEVWINNHYLGMRPYGYSSFQYDLTPYLNYGNNKNIIAVKVDNSKQPNSRWYSGSGIYRNVWLVTTNKIYVDHWGTFVTTPVVNKGSAKVSIQIKVRNSLDHAGNVIVKTTIINARGIKIAEVESPVLIPKDSVAVVSQELTVNNPELWSIKSPYLYKAINTIEYNNKVLDDYSTAFGIRTFYFNVSKGFYLNGKHLKIWGVCDHHDLGCLGAAVNYRAIERQLEILKNMGCNGIRTSHNPPDPELLDLCDKMGFIVMDEAFDMWKEAKTKYDYSLDWDKWHKRDLQDMILRDRNHPSIFMWSIGNEIPEQGDSTGTTIARELAGIIRNLDTTRAITSNCNRPGPSNYIIKSGALDVIGFSYHQNDYKDFLTTYPGQKLIGSETTSALQTRGHYDMPSDSIRRWPVRWDLPFTTGNPDNTCSSYDNCSAPWGETNEEALRTVMNDDFVSGMFIWTGFDYLGEPTPYTWPSRSSYFGVIDLAGFPKDAYYLYQSEWTNKPVLHIFPPWNPQCWTTIKDGKPNWKNGDSVDVWAYTNCKEVELFLNGKSLGTKEKTNDDLHLMWRVPYVPGTLKAVGLNGGKETLTAFDQTAGSPAKISIEPDRDTISADGRDLSFVTVRVMDKDGIMVPYADNLVNFKVSGEGKIIGVDNGSETSHEPFKANYRKAFNGMCLVVIQSKDKSGKIKLEAESKGLKSALVEITAK